MQPWEKAAALTQSPAAQPGALQPWEAAATSQPQDPNVIERIGSDYDKRVGNLQKIADAGAAGKQTGAETVGQQAMQGLGMGVDAGTEAMKGLMDTAGQGLKVIVPGAYEGLQAVKNAVGSVAAPAAQAVAEKYREIVPDDTRLSRNLDAAGNLIGGAATFAPMLKAGAAIGPTVGEAATSAKDAAGATVDAVKAAPGAIKEALTPVNVTRDQIRSEASKAYQFADKTGGVRTPQARNNFLDAVKGLVSDTGEVPIDPQYKALTDFLETNRNKPLTLQGAQDIDQHLSDIINSNVYNDGKPNSLANQVMNIQDHLREMMYKPKPTDVIGGNQGFEAMQEGNRLWQKQAQMRDMEGIFERGRTATQPATAIKNGFAALARSPKRMLGYDSEIQQAIRNAGETGTVTDRLKTMGSRLLPVIGGAVHGPIGAVLGDVASTAARKTATAVQMSKANKVAKMVAKDWQFNEPGAAANMPQPQLALPAPAQDMVADSLGNVTKLTPEQQAAVNASRQEAASLGLTPDVRSNINRVELRKRMGDVWDKIDAQQQEKIAGDIENAWRSRPTTPISQLIDAGKQSAMDLAAAKGENYSNTAMGAALEKAKSLQDISKMNPKDAVEYLNRTRGKK